MSKRFTETDKWKDPSFLKLKPTEKLVWMYIMDNCNNAGFMEWDADVCAMFTGMKLEHVEGAYEGLKRGFKGAKDSAWIYIPTFLKTQKNLPLNPENNAHKQIIALVEDMRPLFASIAKELIGAKKGLISPIGKGKVKDKVKVLDYTPEFEEWWNLYKKGNKRNAFNRWAEHEITADIIMEPTRKYLSYCQSIDRSLLDGEGFINQRAFETDWASQGQKQPRQQIPTF